MKPSFAILILIFAVTAANAQSLSRVLDQSNPFLNDGNGRPLYLQTTNNSEGSPYFNPEYKKANIVLEDGRMARNIKVKFDLLNNQIQYLNEKGAEMIPNLPIRSFIFVEPFFDQPRDFVMFQNGFPAIGRFTPATYYQVLDTGSIKLLKSIKVNYRDDKPYGSPEITRIYEKTVGYYAYVPDGEMIKIEKEKEVFAQIFKTRQEEILAFINEKKLKLKTESDYLEIFWFYQTQQNRRSTYLPKSNN